MSLEDMMARLDPKTRKRVQAAASSVTERLELPSLGLTTALGGGIGKGRQTLIYGNKSAGKSSLVLQSIAKAQSMGQTCALIDAEQSFDPEWAVRLGVDTDNLILSQTKAIDDAVAIGCDLMENGIDLLAVDSIAPLLPSTYFENNDLKEGLEGTKQIGQFSKEIGIAVNKFNYANKNTALLLISQTRNQMNTYGASLKPMGGQAMMFYSSTVIKVWSNASEKEQIKEKIDRGNQQVEICVGRPVDWTIEYNKIGRPNMTGRYNFYYYGDQVGIDNVGEVVDLGIQYGIIEKGGAWLTYKDQKYQGSIKMTAYFKENPDELQELSEQIAKK